MAHMWSTTSTITVIGVLLISHVTGLGDVILHGDVYAQYIGALYTDITCTTVEPETVQNLQAIKWTLDSLRVTALCNSVEDARQQAMRLIVELGASNTSDIIGIIGSEYSSEAEAISRLMSPLPERFRLLQVSLSATAAKLRDRSIYRNFFRTIPPDDLQAKVMKQFLVSMNWTFLAIIHDDNAYGSGGARALLETAKGLDICFPEVIPVGADYNVTVVENLLRERVYRIGRSPLPPVTGIIVFGTFYLTSAVLKAADNISRQGGDAANIRPVFLLSEAAGYLEGDTDPITKGAFVLSPPRRNMSEFETEWKLSLTDNSILRTEAGNNLYFKKMYEQIRNCQFSETNTSSSVYCRAMTDAEFRDQIPNTVYNQYGIQAAMVVAKAVDLVSGKVCPRAASCPQLTNTSLAPRAEFISVLENRHIDFDADFGSFRLDAFKNQNLGIVFNGSADPVFIPAGQSPEYEVYSHQDCPGSSSPCLRKVADYRLGQLKTSGYNPIKCYDLAGTETDCSVHRPQVPNGFRSDTCVGRQELDPVLFEMGDIYIVGIVPVHNVGSSPLECGDIKKGSIDVVEAIRFAVSERQTLFSGKVGVIIVDSCNDPQIIQEKILSIQRLGVYHDGVYEQVKGKILGYIGGWSSDESKAVALITGRLSKVQISYASTAIVLSRRNELPYFLRIPSPDNDQARTMLEIVKTLHPNRTQIQVLYSQSTYGEGGLSLIKDVIENLQYDVCIVNQIPFSAEISPQRVVDSLRANSDAKFVLVFLGSSDVNIIINTLNTLDSNEFLFITSEGWGLRQALIGSIAIASRLWVTDSFENHIAALVPEGSSINPWVRPYMESQFDCYYQWSFDKSSNRTCTSVYDIDSWAPFAERAVQMLMDAGSQFLLSTCGNSGSICPAFANSTDQFLAVLKNERAKKEAQDAKLYPIGSSGEETSFNLQVDAFNVHRPRDSYISSCGESQACGKCFPAPSDWSAQPERELPKRPCDSGYNNVINYETRSVDDGSCASNQTVASRKITGQADGSGGVMNPIFDDGSAGMLKSPSSDTKTSVFHGGVEISDAGTITETPQSHRFINPKQQQEQAPQQQQQQQQHQMLKPNEQHSVMFQDGGHYISMQNKMEF
ncbi:GRM2-like protein [Mya arenaria]|uniref:GRM2-like protein n=1 Tax=Mya arenaria TaxID=6604 RepID=A0ABY7E4V1_MYAAR|nr:GRM2-like protein [Mya arenaria]